VKHFQFVRPRDLAELLRIKAELREKALILDGGTNLLIYIKDGIIREGTIVDVTRLPELRGVHRENGTVEIGAAETMTDLLNSSVLRESIPFIPECLRDFGNLLVRNTSTIGGNIADASPIADSAPPLMVLDAEIIAASSAGTRAIPIDEFFVKPQKTMLKPDEVLVKFRIPVPEAGRGKFIKLGLRRGTSCSVTSEKAFTGAPLDEQTIDRVAEGVKKEISPITDVRGSAEYRREVSVRLLARAVKICAGMEDA